MVLAAPISWLPVTSFLFEGSGSGGSWSWLIPKCAKSSTKSEYRRDAEEKEKEEKKKKKLIVLSTFEEVRRLLLPFFPPCFGYFFGLKGKEPHVPPRVSDKISTRPFRGSIDALLPYCLTFQAILSSSSLLLQPELICFPPRLKDRGDLWDIQIFSYKRLCRELFNLQFLDFHSQSQSPCFCVTLPACLRVATMAFSEVVERSKWHQSELVAMEISLRWNYVCPLFMVSPRFLKLLQLVALQPGCQRLHLPYPPAQDRIIGKAWK